MQAVPTAPKNGCIQMFTAPSAEADCQDMAANRGAAPVTRLRAGDHMTTATPALHIEQIIGKPVIPCSQARYCSRLRGVGLIDEFEDFRQILKHPGKHLRKID